MFSVDIRKYQIIFCCIRFQHCVWTEVQSITTCWHWRNCDRYGGDITCRYEEIWSTLFQNCSWLLQKGVLCCGRDELITAGKYILARLILHTNAMILNAKKRLKRGNKLRAGWVNNCREICTGMSDFAHKCNIKRCKNRWRKHHRFEEIWLYCVNKRLEIYGTAKDTI